MTTKQETPLHIVELRAENVKRLHAVTIRPDGAMVILGGRNAQGKSSTLDAIEMALGGGSKIPPDPIRHGARKGRVVLDLGEIVVERTFSGKGTTLTVTGKDGEQRKSPQALLDGLCSSIAFDPVAFARLPGKEQDAVLKRVLGLDFAALDAKRAAAFAERTEVRRELKGLEARVAALPRLEPGLPAEEQSAADLLAELERRESVKAENDTKRAELRDLERDYRALGEALTEHDAKISRLERELAEARQARDTVAQERDGLVVAGRALRTAVEQLVDPDLAEVKAQLGALDGINRKVRSALERKRLEGEVIAADKRADKLSAEIEAVDEKKAELLASAKFPVPGLGFDEHGPTLNGAPLQQASQAEKLRVSVAIGAALHPRLRVMLLRDGSVLDDDGMRQLAELAAEHDLQLWIERVGDRDASAIVIEDGMVRGDALEGAAE